MIAIEYGSQTRGDADASSDRDLLLLGENLNHLKPKEEEYTARGFSVSVFTEEAARVLSERGSLFFKHIFDEGRLLVGSENKFNDLQKKWAPRHTYRSEVDENIDLLEVVRSVPRTAAGVSAAVDILICSSRSILIRRFAEEGIYLFSWSKLFRRACDQKILKHSAVPLFQQARRIKNAYRSGRIGLSGVEFAHELASASSQFLGLDCKFQFAPAATVARQPGQCPDNSYKQLRAIELLKAQVRGSSELSSWNEAISNPGKFCRPSRISPDGTCY